MRRVLIATSNSGKLREFAVAAALHGVDIAPVPRFRRLPPAVEDGSTFAENARKKAEHYSRYAPGDLVLADDSGLVVDALNGAPGVLSARYASVDSGGESSDATNNAKLLRELAAVPDDQRTARFVCVIGVARDGHVLGEFAGEVAGIILRATRGSGGFGYDPLFLYPSLGKTTAELSPEEKTAVSHRGQAFRRFLDWYEQLL